jgi:hypothetical protein
MIRVLSAKLPAGTAFRDAVKFMTSEGFSHSLEKGRWLDERDDYIYCGRADSVDDQKRRCWKVAVFYRDSKVIKIDAAMKLVPAGDYCPAL